MERQTVAGRREDIDNAAAKDKEYDQKCLSSRSETPASLEGRLKTPNALDLLSMFCFLVKDHERGAD